MNEKETYFVNAMCAAMAAQCFFIYFAQRGYACDLRRFEDGDCWITLLGHESIELPDGYVYTSSYSHHDEEPSRCSIRFEFYIEH